MNGRRMVGPGPEVVKGRRGRRTDVPGERFSKGYHVGLSQGFPVSLGTGRPEGLGPRTPDAAFRVGDSSRMFGPPWPGVD